MTNGLELAELFETPLIVEEVQNAAALNAALRKAIEERRARDPKGLSISNRQGWHSDTQMLDWGGEAAAALVRQVVELADRYTADIGARGEPRYAWVPEMWANISGRGGANQYHTHPGAYWAAVYYVDDGYAGSPDRALGGELEIEDPRMPMLQMDGPDLRFRLRPDAPIADPEILLRPASGRLLLFPAWLRHAVRPYLGTAERISIAINLTPIRVAG